MPNLHVPAVLDYRNPQHVAAVRAMIAAYHAPVARRPLSRGMLAMAQGGAS